METLNILRVIQSIEQKGQNETARRLLQIIGQIYRFAVITGRANQPLSQTFPAQYPPERLRTERSSARVCRFVGVFSCVGIL